MPVMLREFLYEMFEGELNFVRKKKTELLKERRTFHDKIWEKSAGILTILEW